MPHIDLNLVLGIVNSGLALWATYAARRNQKDIDGVAVAAKTKRALDRVSKEQINQTEEKK